MISVLVLTFNEQHDLPNCLRSLGWSDDVHVFDSLSTDQTTELARKAGAHVHQRIFTNYADQRNSALRGIRFKHNWVLLLDADESIPPALAREMQNFVRNAPESIVAARIRRRDYLFGTWLKHAQISPFYIRLVRPMQVHYEREINEVLIPHGAVANLKEHFDHFPFSKGISYWVERHNRYSTMEAKRALAERDSGERFSLWKALFAADFNVKRYHQKGLFFRLPFRPVLKFCYMMFVRRAFLDGYAGWTYARLQAFYEFMIVQKQRELKARAKCQKCG